MVLSKRRWLDVEVMSGETSSDVQELATSARNDTKQQPSGVLSRSLAESLQRIEEHALQREGQDITVSTATSSLANAAQLQ